jgi:hypothetical protein
MWNTRRVPLKGGKERHGRWVKGDIEKRGKIKENQREEGSHYHKKLNCFFRYTAQ